MSHLFPPRSQSWIPSTINSIVLFVVFHTILFFVRKFSFPPVDCISISFSSTLLSSTTKSKEKAVANISFLGNRSYEGIHSLLSLHLNDCFTLDSLPLETDMRKKHHVLLLFSVPHFVPHFTCLWPPLPSHSSIESQSIEDILVPSSATPFQWIIPSDLFKSKYPVKKPVINSTQKCLNTMMEAWM